MFAWATVRCAAAIGSEAFLLSAGAELPATSGPQCDADFGDLVLSNRVITAVVVGADRRIPPGFPIEHGDLIDLHLKPLRHDQLIAYRPAWEGPTGAYATLLVSATPLPVPPGQPARLLSTGRLFDPRTGALLGVDVEHEWSLSASGNELELETWLTNRGRRPWSFTPCDCIYAEGLTAAVSGEHAMATLESPRPRYALGVYASTGSVRIEPATPAMPWARIRFGPHASARTLAPGETFNWSRRIVVDTSTGGLLNAWSRTCAEFLAGIRIAVVDPRGRPVPDVDVRFASGGTSVGERTNPFGETGGMLPSGSYVVYAQRPGCPSVSAEAELFEGQVWRDRLTVADPGVAHFTVVDKVGALPARVRVFGRDGTPDPDLQSLTSLCARGHAACAEDGRLDLPLPPGRYRAVFSHGPRYELEERTFDLKLGQEKTERIKLAAVVDCDGWTACCLYAQSRLSGTSLVGAEDRRVALAADGIDFVAATERERRVDWSRQRPSTDRAGRLVVGLGVELAHPLGFHLVAFPLDAARLGPIAGGAILAHDADPYATLAALPEASGCLTLRVFHSLAELARERRLFSALGRSQREGVLLTDLLPADQPVPSASQLSRLAMPLLAAGGPPPPVAFDFWALRG